MNLYTARCEYIADLKRRGRSVNTLVAAERTLDAFERDGVRTLVPVEQLLVGDVEAFLYPEQDGERALAPASFNRYRSVLHSFFDWCVSRRYCDGNPVDSVPPMAAAAPTPPLILSPEQMLQMLEQANPVERIALALGMNTGLRASDIVSLTVGDVDLSAGYIATGIQKTSCVDRKPITKELEGELWRWFRAYTESQFGDAHEVRNRMPENDWYLVPSYQVPIQPNEHRRGIPPSAGLVTRPTQQLSHPHRLVQRALERQGLPTAGQGFHTLRRSSARALFELLRTSESADHALMVVKEFLNHKSTAQTEKYLGINHERAIRDDVLRGKNFLTPQPTSGEMLQEMNGRHGVSYDNPARLY